MLSRPILSNSTSNIFNCKKKNIKKKSPRLFLRDTLYRCSSEASSFSIKRKNKSKLQHIIFFFWKAPIFWRHQVRIKGLQNIPSVAHKWLWLWIVSWAVSGFLILSKTLLLEFNSYQLFSKIYLKNGVKFYPMQVYLYYQDLLEQITIIQCKKTQQS